MMINSAWRFYAAAVEKDSGDAWKQDPYLSYVFPAVQTYKYEAILYAAKLESDGGSDDYEHTSAVAAHAIGGGMRCVS